MSKLRVLSYNIHKGFNLTNTKFVIEEIKATIQQTQADIALLQEVGGTAKLASQFEYLADGLWPHFAYGQNSVYQSGHHGNAILSKFPIFKKNNLNLTVYRLEKRGLLHAIIQIGSETQVHLLTVHLDLLARNRRVQVKSILEYVQLTIPKDAKVILGGDFNDWSEEVSKVLKSELDFDEAHMKIHNCHGKTFPSFFPILALDRVYYRNLKATKSEVLSSDSWLTLSDHLALVTEFIY